MLLKMLGLYRHWAHSDWDEIVSALMYEWNGDCQKINKIQKKFNRKFEMVLPIRHKSKLPAEIYLMSA